MMEQGDHNKKHQKDGEDNKRNQGNRKRHRKRKNNEGQAEASPSCNGRNSNEPHRRKRGADENGSSYKHKNHEERKSPEEIYSNEKKHHKESKPTAKPTAERKAESNKKRSARSTDNIGNKSTKQASLRKLKTFHMGQTSHLSRSSEMEEEKEKPTERKKHRARSNRKPEEKHKVSQIWYCQIDSTVPFKYYKKAERPDTVPMKYSRNAWIKKRAKSTPEQNTNGEFYEHSSHSRDKTHYSKESRRGKYERITNKEDISKKIEAEYTKKIESNLKTYFGKIEKLIDKKLNDYLNINNSKLRETIDDNVKYIERERNKHQRRNDDTKEKRVQKRRSSIRSMSSQEDSSERIRRHSSIRTRKRSASKLSGRQHHNIATDTFSIEEKCEDIRHHRTGRTSKNESHHNAMTQATFKEKRHSNDGSPSTRKETNYQNKKDGYTYTEMNFERGYLRGDIRTNEDKKKKVKKSKVKTQAVETVGNPYVIENPAAPLTESNRKKYKNKEDRCVEDELKMPHEINSRSHKLPHQYIPFGNLFSNKTNNKTSVVYLKPTFSRKNIPSFSVYEKDSLEFFDSQKGQQVGDYVSSRRYSQESGKVSPKKNNFIVEGIEPAKRLVSSSAKPTHRKHPKNMECKTVSVITIPSQSHGNKYFSLDDTVENTNKMKRLKLYYQYSLDSNKCSGSTFSEEKSVVSESVKIFSDFSDQNNAKTLEEGNVERLSNPNQQCAGADSQRKSTKHRKTKPKLDKYPKEISRKASERSIVQNKNTPSEDLNRDDKSLSDNEMKKSPREELEESVKIHEETTVFNVEILRSAIQAHKDIDKQFDGCQNPNKQILNCLENMYRLFVSTLHQNNLIREKANLAEGQNTLTKEQQDTAEEKKSADEETPNTADDKQNTTEVKQNTNEKQITFEEKQTTSDAENNGTLLIPSGEPQMKTTDTSYHELTDAQVSKVDQITSYHSASKLPENSMKTIDQVTSYHQLNQYTEDNTKKKQLVDQISSYHEVVDKAAGKDVRSTEIMTILDPINTTTSRSVTTVIKELEDEQTELQTNEVKAIEVVDTNTHSTDPIDTVINRSATTTTEDLEVSRKRKQIELQTSEDKFVKIVDTNTPSTDPISTAISRSVTTTTKDLEDSGKRMQIESQKEIVKKLDTNTPSTDLISTAISRSVTTTTKDLEDSGKKKQIELHTRQEEIIKIFDANTHNIDSFNTAISRSGRTMSRHLEGLGKKKQIELQSRQNEIVKIFDSKAHNIDSINTGISSSGRTMTRHLEDTGKKKQIDLHTRQNEFVNVFDSKAHNIDSINTGISSSGRTMTRQLEDSGKKKQIDLHTRQNEFVNVFDSKAHNIDSINTGISRSGRTMTRQLEDSGKKKQIDLHIRQNEFVNVFDSKTHNIDSKNTAINRSGRTMTRDLEDWGKKKQTELQTRQEIVKMVDTNTHSTDPINTPINRADRTMTRDLEDWGKKKQIESHTRQNEFVNVFDTNTPNIDSKNTAISRSGRTMTRHFEDSGRKKQTELPTRQEMVKMVDTNPHNIDVQTIFEEGSLSEEFCEEKISHHFTKTIMEETTSTGTDIIKNKKLGLNNNRNPDKSGTLKFEPVFKNTPLIEQPKEVNEQNNETTLEVAEFKKNPPKSKKTADSFSKIPRRIKQTNTCVSPGRRSNNQKNNLHNVKKSRSAISVQKLSPRKEKSKLSSLVCLHKYPNCVHFPNSSGSCMDNYYLRATQNEQNVTSRLLLTKHHRSPQLSSYQKRKIYDKSIRTKMKKKSVTLGKKLGHVIEVRYLTVDEDFKTPEKLSENGLDNSKPKSLDDLINQTLDTFGISNVAPRDLSKATLIDLLRKALASAEITLRQKCAGNNYVDFFKELKSCLKLHLYTETCSAIENPESTIQMNQLTFSVDSNFLPNTETYTISNRSINSGEYNCSSLKLSDSSSNFLYAEESQTKITVNPILGFAFKGDNVKTNEIGSFAESQNSEESGYISSPRSRYNMNFFKNPAISELLKPQRESVHEEIFCLHPMESSSLRNATYEYLPNSPNDSTSAVKNSCTLPSKEKEQGSFVCESMMGIRKNVSNKNVQSSSHNSPEEEEEYSLTPNQGEVVFLTNKDSPLDLHLPKSSLDMLGIRKSISDIDVKLKCSDEDLRKVQSETILESKTHILKTVQYIDECGDAIYSRSMQLHTEIIEHNCKVDVSLLKKILDNNVYLISTNLNTGCITLVAGPSLIADEESRPNDVYDFEDVKMLVTKKIFRNLFSLYERESLVSELLFDDRTFLENELYPSVRSIKNFSSKNRFGRKVRTFLKKIFFNRSKVIETDVVSAYTEKGIPLDEYYQKNFQILAEYVNNYFSALYNNVCEEEKKELKYIGFASLLEKIKNGDFVFLKVEEDINIEENIKNEAKQAFRSIYLKVYNEARKCQRKLTYHDMNLVGAFVCKYRIGLISEVDLITSYLGRGFFETETELKAALFYVMNVRSSSIIELDDFENSCKGRKIKVSS